MSIRGIGVDAVDIDRMRQSLSRTPSMEARVFTQSERDDLAERADPVPGYAARFAAREAVMKAMGLGIGEFGFHDAFITRADSGEPALRVTGTAARLAEARGITRWHVTLTHSDTVAIAFVVAEGD